MMICSTHHLRDCTLRISNVVPVGWIWESPQGKEQQLSLFWENKNNTQCAYAIDVYKTRNPDIWICIPFLIFARFVILLCVGDDGHREILVGMTPEVNINAKTHAIVDPSWFNATWKRWRIHGHVVDTLLSCCNMSYDFSVNVPVKCIFRPP